VARSLNERGFATLLFDLLTEPETVDRANVFDIPLLAGRLEEATRWALGREDVAALPIAYFGASTGAAAALRAAADLRAVVRAVVSRGGRPDLAADRLPLVTAPTLLVVGGHDQEVLALNQRAAALMRAPHQVAVVPRAGHLFEEPGALGTVAEAAGDWFERHLVAPPAKAAS
jgi:pimeloyl-ACP methyl ester carboxylesterase